MKTIGLLGGMSWESTTSYYQMINREVATRLGGLHSAKLAMVSVDFAQIETLQRAGEWSRMGDILSNEAGKLVAAGAELLVLCTNTMHKVAGQIADATSVPFLHIADAVGSELQRQEISTAGLLGTRFTMQQDFYRERLREKHGIEVLTPTDEEQTKVHQVIYDELCQGNIKPASRLEYISVIDNLHECGAQGIILGCTEIGLLVQQSHTKVRLLDSTEIHAKYAVERALASD